MKTHKKRRARAKANEKIEHLSFDEAVRRAKAAIAEFERSTGQPFPGRLRRARKRSGT